MRVFNHFPEKVECPICNTGEDKPCCLIPVDGTDDDGICEAVPVHCECIADAKGFRFSREVNVIYKSAI